MHVCDISENKLVADIRDRSAKGTATAYFAGISECPRCGNRLLVLVADGKLQAPNHEAERGALERAVEIARARGHADEIASFLGAAGEMYTAWQEYAAAENAYREGIKVLSTQPRSQEVAAALQVNLANLLQDQGRLEDARDTLLHALEFYENSGDVLGKAQVLGNLGAVYQDIRDFTASIDAYIQASRLYKLLDDLQSQAEILSNLAFVYANAGQPDRALSTCRQAIAVVDVIGYSPGAVHALINLGTLLREAGQTDAAELAFRGALAAARRGSDTYSEAIARRNLSDTN